MNVIDEVGKVEAVVQVLYNVVDDAITTKVSEAVYWSVSDARRPIFNVVVNALDEEVMDERK
jgi:nucleoside-triphosphatase THEP1